MARENATEFRLLIFDWDGTLVDSIGRIVGCTQETLEELGLPEVEAEHIQMSIGLGIREMVEAFVPDCDDELFARILEVYRDLWRQKYSVDPKLFAGAGSTLEGFAAEGYLLAVATAKNRYGLRRDLAGTGLDTLFHTTRTVDEAPAKPSPEMLLQILEELGVCAEEALMIGDTVHDLQMAVNAGVPALGVTSGSHQREDLAVVSALDYLEGVSAMPEWLRRRRLGREGE